MRKQKPFGFKKILRIVQETPPRWNSTFYMLQRLVLLKQPVFLNKNSGLTKEEPPVLQVELLLLPKDDEMSDEEDNTDDLVAIESETDESDTSNQ